MNWKKIGIIAAVALVIWLVVSNPHGAAGGVHHGLGWLKDGANSIVTFIQGVFA
ncbi:hypothetical protein [Amycolatopsis sp. NPDC004378]